MVHQDRRSGASGRCLSAEKRVGIMSWQIGDSAMITATILNAAG